MDLSRGIEYRSTQLNTVTVSSAGITGIQTDSADTSELEFRQFTEPRALQDGHSLGPVWQGGRRVHLMGTIYGLTRASAFDQYRALETALYPTAAYIADPTTMGFVPLYFYEVGDPVPVLHSIDVRSDGLRVQWVKTMFGGDDLEPLAIPWSCTFVARDPEII